MFLMIFKSSAGELDDQLNPVGKEVFTMEEEQEEEDAADGEEGEDYSGEGRPGTTKRKQYYFKRVSGFMWFTVQIYFMYVEGVYPKLFMFTKM